MADLFTSNEAELIAGAHKIRHALWFLIPTAVGASTYDTKQVHVDSDISPDLNVTRDDPGYLRVIDWGERTTQAYNVSLQKPGEFSASTWLVELRNDDGLCDLDNTAGIWANGSSVCMNPSRCLCYHKLTIDIAHHGESSSPFAVDLPGNFWRGRINHARFIDGRENRDGGTANISKGRSCLVEMEPQAVAAMRDVIGIEHGWTTDTGLNLTV